MKSLLRLFGPGEALIALMALVAGSSLVGALTGWQFFPVVGAGVSVAISTSLVARRYRLHIAEWLALNIAALAIFGAFVTSGVPTPHAYSIFFRGLIDGWADVLSSVPATELTPEYRVVPYVLAWLAATAGLGLLRMVRLPGFGALGPLAAFGLGLLFTVEHRLVSLLQGGLLAGLALALGVFQQRDFGMELDQSIGNTTVLQKRRRFLGAALVLLLIAGVSPAVASVIPGFSDRERFDLRDRLVPPWEPLDEASPLAQIKANYDDNVKQDVAFTVSGETIPGRFALATLAHYDGRVWTVGTSDLNGSAPFVTIDHRTPTTVDAYETESIELVITPTGMDGVWFPLPGQLIEVSDQSDESTSPMRFNRWTGTLALPEGVRGKSLAVVVRTAPVLNADELEQVSVVLTNPLEVEGQTGLIRSRSADIVEGVSQGWPQVEAIQVALTNGYYSADLHNNPGHSWGRLTDFFAQEQWFGNEEQYAAVAGIVARNSGLPARVVVGYKLGVDKPRSGKVDVQRDEAAAWIEVKTVEYGWVAVDVTPDRGREPDFSDPGVRTEAVAAPNPPPPPPPPPDIEAERPDEDDEELEDDEEDEVQPNGGPPVIALIAAGSIGGPLSAGCLWLAAFGTIKALRRRRRRRANDLSHRTANAWHEVSDRVWESGWQPQQALSVLEQARCIESSIPPASGVTSLALVADKVAFGPTAATEEVASQAWDECDLIKNNLRANASFFERVRRLGDPRPVVKGWRR